MLYQLSYASPSRPLAGAAKRWRNRNRRLGSKPEDNTHSKARATCRPAALPGATGRGRLTESLFKHFPTANPSARTARQDSDARRMLSFGTAHDIT